jgi:hypothetical protein
MKEIDEALEAMDAFAIALEQHGAAWTPRERQLFENAIAKLEAAEKLLKRKNNLARGGHSAPG